MPKSPSKRNNTSTNASGWKTASANIEGERKKRNHRLITRGGAAESIAPKVRGISERAFFLLMKKVFSLPEVAALMSHAADQQKGG